MDISVKTTDNCCTFQLKGRLDLTSSSQLKDRVQQSVSEGNKNILLNMSQVDFINSSGLGTLVSTLKVVRTHNGRIVLSSLAPYVQEIFEITQLSHIFEIFETESEACQSFEKAPAVNTV